MNSFVKLCIFLFFTVEGSQGSEVTINVRRNASVTLVCSSREELGMCYCTSYLQNCHKCIDVIRLNNPFKVYSKERYFRLSGLKHGNSGLYACFSSPGQRLGKKYRLNVFEDQDPTVLIGTVGQSIIMSCSTDLDIMAASQKHWCRLANASVCQPDTVMGPKVETRGYFKILDSHRSFSLEKRQLTHDDAGFYRFTQIFHNQTKVHVVELQVKDKPNFLQISPVRVKPKPDELFEISCQYSQELQEFSKSWLCDNSECDETVTSIDDRFQSALVLTIDHVACSNIRSFQCVAKMPGNSLNSTVYRKPLNQNPVVDVMLNSYLNKKKVKVNTYSLLNLVCFKPERYNWEHDGVGWSRWGTRYSDYYYTGQSYWCRVSQSQCLTVKNNVRETIKTLILQICVTPKDNGITYRCPSSRWNTDVEIVVMAPPPPPPQPVPPAGRPIAPGNSEQRSNSGGIIIVVTSIILLIIILCVTVTRCNGQKLSERLFARRAPLSAVDVHANMYANSVAHYYSHHQRHVALPDKLGEGDDKETSSSSDDEFEELPVPPQTSSSVMPEETDYIRVKPGGAALSQHVHDSDQFGQVGPPLCNCDNVSGLARKGEVGYNSKTNNGKVLTKQGEDAAQISSGGSNNKEDDEHEVTYTHVIFKPKHRLK